MKKLILFLILSIPIFNEVFSQVSISNPVRLTNGNNDRNPSFANNRNSYSFINYDWEFMTFERVTGSSSGIWVTKIGDSGSLDGEYNIIDDSYINKNPSIAYNKPGFLTQAIIKYAVIVWESNKFGRQSVFISSYKSSTGWSSPFILDSSNTDNVTPKVCLLDSINFSIVYQSGEDIKYKKYNIITNTFSLESNVTIADPNRCSNPHVILFRDNLNNPRVWICYEKEISVNRNGIYLTSCSTDSIPLQIGTGDTIAFAGNNRNLGFGNDKFANYVIFESDRNGTNINIYGTSFLQHQQNTIVENTSNDFINYAGGDFGITDNAGFQNMIYSHNIKTAIGLNIKIAFSWWSGYSATHKISNDPLYRTAISISNSIRVPNTACERHWFVYNKDSLNQNYPSTIYGVFYTNCLTDIKQNVNSNPGNFLLRQNYPNPFNPTTVINYEIPSNVKGQTSNVKLVVFNALGKEVATLVNENQNAGSYQIEFDGSNLSSGIYFYKLTTESFTDIKKMTLLK